MLDWRSEINNTQIGNAKDIVKVMPVYNLIEYNDNYSKTSGSLWQFYHGVKENINEHNPNWSQIPDHPYRILIIGGSGSRKTNSLLI